MIGTIFGSTLTVGLAAVLMHVGGGAERTPARAMAAEAPHVAQAAAPAVHAVSLQAPKVTSVVAAPAKAKVMLAKPAPLGASDPRATTAPAPSPAPEPTVLVDEDPLMREASLVAEARGALMRGDAAGALHAIETAKALPARQLQPEELALEARALRALGRSVEAQQVGGALKTSYPDNALAR